MIQLALTVVALATFAAVMAIYLEVRARAGRLRELRRRLRGNERAAHTLLRAGQGYRSGRLAMWLEESGLGWTPQGFRRWVALAAGTGALLGGVAGGPSWAVLIGVVAALALPAQALRARRTRLRRLDQQLPQALQIMMLALRAGQSLPGALALAARESPEPLQTELRRAVEEQSLGSPIGEVIQQLAGRLRNSEAAGNLALAVNVLAHTGGDLIAVIHRIINSTRSRALYRARLRAVTTQGRWSATMLGLMPPGFVVLAGLLDPTYWSTLLAGRGGLVVLGSLVTLWGSGVLWTYRMVSKAA